ncbi:S-layer homology domain-containing protein [Lysinibacillus sp. NPDC095746]|uniref:S-layer homology domain-containing protein n=1 Tax=Lysinibacillus sp. NPDC095746 TaxID=3364134 RepID=UPI00380FE0B9
MANQPKKYKKFVATAATATLVAAAIVPVASAASFTDVTDTNSHKDAISNLVDAGIIKGYPDGTFKPDQFVSRGQVVKLLGRWLETEGYEIPTDWNTKQRFNDLPVTTADKELVQYAALAKDAGAFNGANGNLNYSQNMARQQMAIVLVRAIKEIQKVDLVKEYKDAKFTSEISDLGGLNTEQREAITALEYAELTKAATLPGKAFKPNDTITRAQFASFLDRTMKLEVPSHAKAAVKAINNTTVEVTFDQEVDNVQALNFEIKDLEVKNAAVKLTNKKVVVLTTAPQTADKEYTVSLGGEEIGKFKGVNAVIPTKVDLVEKSTQGKLGQQVTLKAQVTVAEGASKAGIPVTFFIPGSANGVKAPVTVEAVTNDEGIATYSYTRYAATNDTVTVYANGDRSKFSTGYVFWAVDTTLTITEVTTGSTVNNGANKVYKVTYKDPDTGKPVSGKTLNVSVKENIDVTVDKLQDVTINGVRVAQTSSSNIDAAQITTDSKGEATFTMTGSNAEVTPVVFVGETGTGKNVKQYNADALQVTAAKVKFGATQADYTLEVTRDGGEEAATTFENGRKYKVVVKNKDGKLAANETVNVAFNEDIDGVISTTTEAKFVKVEDGKQTGWDYKYDKDAKQIIVKTDSKGEATFVIGNDKANSYATPIVWIDVNYQSGKVGTLDKGEPSAIAPISYFQTATIDGSKLVAKDGKGEEASKFVGKDPAKFEVVLVNQSGKTMKNSGYTTPDVSYSIENTGANELKVKYTYNKVEKTQEVGSNRTISVIADNGTIEVFSEENKSSSVKVLATGIAKKYEGDKVVKEFAFSAKEATATFTSTSEVTNLFSGDIKEFNTDKKTIVFTDGTNDKSAVKYAGETDTKYTYKDVNGAPLSEDGFIGKLKDAITAKKSVKATYEKKDKEVTFYLVTTEGGNTPPVDTEKVKEDEKAELEKAKTALNEAIKTAEDAKLDEAKYTADSWKVYADALKAAKADVSKATKAEIEKLTKDLTDAQKALKTKAEAEAEADAKAKEAVKAEAAKITTATIDTTTSKLNLPVVADGYTVAIKSSSDTVVIKVDGTVTPDATADKDVDVVFTVTSKDGKYTADSAAIKVTVPKTP